MSAPASKPRGAAPLVPGRTVAERYVVQRVLGQGGMGQVVEVEHVALGRRFALKVLRLEKWNDELVRRFNREARALAKMTTPRVAQVTDFGVDAESGPFYVMELLEGETLEDRIERCGPVGAREAVAICAELCDALAEVHAAGIVHRDLKPSNVGLPHSGPVGVKLLDFGLAASMDDSFLSKITQSQQILGSLPYMAPEQFNGAEPAPAMDVYAVGIVLFESVSGRLPFMAPSTAALIHQILATPIPALPPELSGLGVLEPLLERLLAKEASERFSSASAAAEALRAAAAQLGGATRGPHPRTREIEGAELSDMGRAVGGIGLMATMASDAHRPPPVESGMRLAGSMGPASPGGAAPHTFDGAHTPPPMSPTIQSPSVGGVAYQSTQPVHPSYPMGSYPQGPAPMTSPSESSGWVLRLGIAVALGIVFAGLTAVGVVTALNLLDRGDTRAAAPPPTAPDPATSVRSPSEPPVGSQSVGSQSVGSASVGDTPLADPRHDGAGADGAPSVAPAAADPATANPGAGSGETAAAHRVSSPQMERPSPRRPPPARSEPRLQPEVRSFGDGLPIAPSPPPRPPPRNQQWRGNQRIDEW